jgi:hypothetical protein
MSYAIGQIHPQCPWAVRPGMAFHHVIPRSILIRVFNRLLAGHVESAEAEARTCLFQFLALCNRNHPGLERVADRLRSDPRAPRRAGHNPLAPLAIHEVTEIHRSVIWPAWDVVEGPAKRGDDPADHYLDRFTAGLTADEAQQMRAIEELFPALQAAITSGPSASLGASIRAARMRLNRPAPIRYRPDMWDETVKPARKRR